MAKKIQLQIPFPCHENWENMTAVEKGRFCTSCQKKVIDFSNMSDREVAMFFKKPSTNSVCGRFTEEQLNRDIEIPKKRIPWIKYFFQFTLPAFLISMKTSAQMKKSTKKIIEHVCTKTMGDTVLNRTAYSDINIVPKNPKFEFNNAVEVTFGFISYRVSDTIKGKVVDEEGNPIPFAAVTIKDTKKEAMTDANGLFSIYQKDEWSDLTLVAMSVGFESREIKINRSNYESFSSIILFTLKPQLTGKVVVVGYTAAKKKKPIPLLKQIFKDTAFKSFKIYPNPISSNSALYIEWKLKDFGYHSLQLFNQSGQLVFTNELYIDEKARLLTINTPMIPAGSYFLKITNKTTGRSFTEKLVVE